MAHPSPQSPIFNNRSSFTTLHAGESWIIELLELQCSGIIGCRPLGNPESFPKWKTNNKIFFRMIVFYVPPKKLTFRFRISLSDMTNYKSAFGKVCRIKNRQTFKSMPILNSAYHAVKYAELRIGILLKICRFVIRHITTWYGMPN